MKGIDEIKNIIREFQLRKIPSFVDRTIQVDLDLPIISILIGPRRSGKTYMLYKLVKDLKKRGVDSENIVYIDFEDERLNLVQLDLDFILKAYFELYPKIEPKNVWFFFDEIQNVEGWEGFVRRLFDNYSQHIFIAGTNSKLLSTEIADVLRDRTITYTVYPLNFKEYLDFRKINFELHDTRSRAVIQSAAMEFIVEGAFPEVVKSKKEVRRKVLQSYFNTILYRDIVERYKVADVQLLRFFSKKLFASVGKPLSVNKIYRDLKSMGYSVSNNYLYNFYDYAENVFMISVLKKYDPSKIKQDKADKKLYAIDSGLLAAMDFSMSGNLGKLFENTVYAELLKAKKQVFYHKALTECDFIIQEGNDLHALQVAWNVDDDETLNRELKALHEIHRNFEVKSFTLLTFDTKRTIPFRDIVVEILPFLEWVGELHGL